MCMRQKTINRSIVIGVLILLVFINPLFSREYRASASGSTEQEARRNAEIQLGQMLVTSISTEVQTRSGGNRTSFSLFSLQQTDISLLGVKETVAPYKEGPEWKTEICIDDSAASLYTWIWVSSLFAAFLHESAGFELARREVELEFSFG